jgi:hypothetical protein
MGFGEAWWILGHPPEGGRVEDLLKLFDQYGLHLRHPVDQRIYVFDDVGSRREAPISFVASAWVDSTHLTMQLWLDRDIDVVLSVAPGGQLVRFSLDGLSTREALQTVGALVLCVCAVDATQGLVVDRYLPDTGEEWVSAFEFDRAADFGEPDLLIGPGPDGTRTIRLGLDSWLRSAES